MISRLELPEPYRVFRPIRSRLALRFGLKAVFLVVFVVACVAGWWHIRNLPSEQEKAAMLRPRVQKLVEATSNQIPSSLGAWEGGRREVDPSIRATSGLHVINWYQFTKGDLQADIALCFGSPASVALSTGPQDWRTVNNEVLGLGRINMASSSATPHELLWQRVTEKDRPSNDYYHFWAFTTAGTWEAPTNPRPYYFDAPWVFGVSLWLHGGQLNDGTARTIGVDLMQTFFSELDQRLFASMRDDRLIQRHFVRP